MKLGTKRYTPSEFFQGSSTNRTLGTASDFFAMLLLGRAGGRDVKFMAASTLNPWPDASLVHFSQHVAWRSGCSRRALLHSETWMKGPLVLGSPGERAFWVWEEGVGIVWGTCGPF